MTTWYTKEHEWISVEGDIGTVGITAFAAEKLGDVVFVELPAIGATLAKEDEMATVESVKAASPVYSPVTGQVTAVNKPLVDEKKAKPELVNEDPEGEGWFVKLKLANPGDLSGLMDKAAYDAFCNSL